MSGRVLVLGSGPTGLPLANLLGGFGVPTLLVERHPGTVQEPRAVSIDDESLRVMQAAGLLDAVARDVVAGYGSRYRGPDGRVFLEVSPTERPYGHPRRNAFRQPLPEATLRPGLARFACVEARYGWTLNGFTAGADGVRAQLAGPGGLEEEIAADWRAACDGASSGVRASLGIALEGASFEERWLICDLDDQPNPERHTTVFCDSARPAILLPGPQDTRRCEFKLLPGETDAELLDEATVARLLASHGASPAARLARKTVYRFHARLAGRWRCGRRRGATSPRCATSRSRASSGASCCRTGSARAARGSGGCCRSPCSTAGSSMSTCRPASCCSPATPRRLPPAARRPGSGSAARGSRSGPGLRRRARCRCSARTAAWPLASTRPGSRRRRLGWRR